MRIAIISIVILALLLGCDTKTSVSPNLYIGAYRSMDQLIPYPYIIYEEETALHLYNNEGKVIDSANDASLEAGDDIRFKTKHFELLGKGTKGFMAFDVLDTLNFRKTKNNKPIYKNSAIFKQVHSEVALDIDAVKAELVNSVWAYDVIADENSTPNNDFDITELFHFNKDSVDVITSYSYEGLNIVSQKTSKTYHVFEVAGVYFLSFEKTDDNPQPIYQILSFDSEKLVLKDFSSREVKDVTYNKQATSPETYKEALEAATSYSNCFDGFQGQYYYGDDVTYNKGNAFLVDYVKEGLPETETNSGYVIVHFNINCEKRLGDFGLILMDRQYKATTFSKDFVYHIVNKVRVLTDFPSSASQIEWLEYEDVHAFLMFKITNGKLVDLCP